MIELTLKRNGFYDGSGSPWIVYNARNETERGYDRAFATDSDLDALGVDEATKEEATRGYEVTFETLSLDYWGDMLDTTGY